MHMVLFSFVLLYLLLLMSMLWHRQTIFESKGDTLSSSAECRIRTHGLRHQIASSLNARWQTDWAIEDQAKNLELISPSLWSASIQPTRPHYQMAFTWLWRLIYTCLLLLISILWHRQTLFESKGDKLSFSADTVHPIKYAYSFV